MAIEHDLIYLTIPHEILYHPKLDPTGKMLLSFIAYRDHDETHCTDSNEDIGAVLGVSERTIRRALSELKGLGYVEQYGFDGRERSLMIASEYLDLLRGGKGKTRPARMTGQVGKLAGQSDIVARQNGQNGRAISKDERTGKELNKGKKPNASSDAPEPDPEPTAEEVQRAIAELRERLHRELNPATKAGQGLIREEVARLRRDGAG